MTKFFAGILAFLAVAFPGWADQEDVEFYREKVYPVLKDNCFKCHGGGEKLKGEFRVTSREGLVRGGELGSGLNEDDPAQSLLLKMISYSDDEHQMPPEAKLRDEEIAILSNWFAKGAPYDPELEIKGDPNEKAKGFSISDEARGWWAYRPISSAGPPVTKRSDWSRNEIDSFILAKLEGAGLSPNPDASPEALIRRVFYDLTGLPPRPERVETFAIAYRKDSAKAYDALIEELLASPRYGEKWARHWLDLVRYAESNGFERDNPKPEIWKYRDYVIAAFNSDKPYDQFVIEQLAGDEIENRSRDSLAATGYHRLMQWDDEPADRKQHVYDVLADNVQITSEAFLATTIGCARCHDHKADPVSQKDYYSFMSFFHGVTHYNTPGTIYHWASKKDREAFEKTRAEKIAQLRSQVSEDEQKIRAFLTDQNLLKRKGNIPEKVFVRSGRHENAATWEYSTRKPTQDWKDVGFRDKMWLKASGGFGTNTPNNARKTDWNSKEIWMRTNFGLKDLPETLTLELYHDEDAEIYLNGVEIHRATGYLTNYKMIPLGKKALDALQTGKNVLAIHCKNGGGGQYIDAGLRNVPSESVSLEDVVRSNGGKKLINRIKEHFKEDLYTRFLNRKKEIENWKRRQAGEALNVVKEPGPQPQPMHVHLRGSAHAMGDPVEPGFPAVLSSKTNDPVPASVEQVSWEGGKTSGRRRALAQWIVSDENPISSRVMVNRIWQHHFGRGIVPSTSDFGKLGELPTHPELLDWLAHRFKSGGWKVKDLHRLILKSRSYQMSSAPNSANSQGDPNNDLFWRNNMRRLTAEEVRDSILAVSGKLEERMGGKWVYPPLPQEVLQTASRPGAGWPVSRDEADHYRRSIYIHVKRSLRHPMMADFDQADTDSACAVRFVTTVPNQALMMLNSKFVNDHAKVLGERIRGLDGDVESRIKAALYLVTQSEPASEDVARCLELYQRFQSDAGLSADEALNRVALLALNLNEFLYLD